MRTRFAPAPTGYLHLGHVLNALFVWGTARALGGEVLLRIEDHDRQRCRPGYERALLDDLDWLGLVPDVGSAASFGAGASPFRQSDNSPRYEAALEQLAARGHHLYACDCSRRDQATRPPAHGGPEPTPAADPSDARRGPGLAPPASRPEYDGHCRHRALSRVPGHGIRLELATGLERFDDLRLGPQAQEPALQSGDLLLRDRLGNWTYHCCVVVDDITQGIDLVVRGEDLLDSTGRQLALARMLGRVAPPRFLHHPLIRRPDGAKLSKADGDTSIRDLRDAGLTPEHLFGRALAAAGMLEGERPLALEEALALVAGPA